MPFALSRVQGNKWRAPEFRLTLQVCRPHPNPILHDSLIMVIAASGNHTPLANSESPLSYLPSELEAELKILRLIWIGTTAVRSVSLQPLSTML
jgi:hypothetical protein